MKKHQEKISRKKFIKNSAMAMLSYSMYGCTSLQCSNDFNRKYGHSPNYHNGKFKNLIKTSEGRKPGTFFDMAGQIVFGDEVREPAFKLPVNHPGPSFFKSSPANGLCGSSGQIQGLLCRPD